MLDFVVLPIVIILQSLIQSKKYSESYFTSSLWLYPLTSLVIVVLWLPMQIQVMFRALMAEVPRRKEIRVLRGIITDWETLY